MSLIQEEIPPQQDVVETSDFLESLKSTEELPEATQPNQSTKGELQIESNDFELTHKIKKEDLPPGEHSDVQQQTIASSEVVKDITELEPANSTETFPEVHKNEKQDPPKTTELLEPEKSVISEPPEVVEVTGEQSLKFVTEAFQDPNQVLPDSR